MAYGPPTAYGYGQMPPAPPNYLVWSILTTVFCCLPFGVVSLIFAAQVNGRWASGDVQGAWDASRKARTWAIASAGTTVATLLLLGLGAVVIGVMAA